MYAVAVTTYVTRNCYLAYSRSHTENFRSGVRGICHGRICGFSLSKGGLVCIRIGAHASHHPIVHAHLWRVWGLQALQQGYSTVHVIVHAIPSRANCDILKAAKASPGRWPRWPPM